MPTPSQGPARTDPAGLPVTSAEPLLDARGQVVAPVLLVDLDQPDGRPIDPDVVAAATVVAEGSDRIVVGVCRSAPDPVLTPLVSALDLTLVPEGADYVRQLVGVPDPDAAAVALHEAAAASPGAAIVLAGLLRWTGQLPVPAALEAESLAYSTLLGGPEFRGWLHGLGPRLLPPPAVTEPVLIEGVRDRLRVTLNRPERGNTYGRELRAALVDALEQVERDPCRPSVLLDGAGPTFCAGSDLYEFGGAADPVAAHLLRTRRGAAPLLHRLADRVEARVHGECVGAGVELPAFAGRVVAAADATFRLPEVGMGLIPGAGGTVGVPARIGRWRTLHLALTGRTLTAQAALSWGLVDEVTGGGAWPSPR